VSPVQAGEKIKIKIVVQVSDHVELAGASFQCHGDKSSSATCKASVKAGAQVHVKGTLTACTTSAASATATQVMPRRTDWGLSSP